MEEFLSNKYLRFVKALDSLFNLQASKTHVFGIKPIGGEILLLAAVKNYNGEYLSREVASGVSAGHRKLLESQSNVMISHITSDPCLTSPCPNGATCNQNIYISQDVAALESPGVIFVSPQMEVFNCTCPAGFTGTLCEDDIDECEVRFCQNDGTCVNTAGSFYCHCQSGFSGSVCSTDVDECLKLKCQNGGTCLPNDDGYYCHCAPGFEGEVCDQFIDHCRSTPCVQGNCINSQTGFFCQCPFGVNGVHCEEHSYGFEDLSFMEFPSLDRRTNLISLEFATVQSDSLLLYNPGGASSREFFALEIVDGTLHLSYDLGSGPVRLHTHKQVADGHFHSVAARRIGNMGSLHVDNCTDVDNNGFCFSQSDGISSERTLDVGGSNMTFGGMRTVEFILQHPAQIKTHDFVGCIRNIHVNGFLLRASMALATYNILDKCPRAAVSPCHSDPCQNGGVCHDLWSDYLCECKSPFIGRKCAKESSEEVVLRFTGNDYMEYVIKEKFKRDFLLKQLLDDKKEGNDTNKTWINIKFKTRNNGVLMSVVGQTGYIVLKIKDRRLVYRSEDAVSGHQSDFTVDSQVADGVWHVVSLFGRGQIPFLALDGKPVGNITDQSVDLSPARVEKIVLGADLTLHSKLQQSGFTGCVQYVNVSGHTLPVSGRSAMVDIWPSWTLMQSSCMSPGVCLPSPCSEEDTARRGCLYGQCENRWRCGPAGENSSCICFHNVSDHACDICISAPDSQDLCSGAGGSEPLWLIAVILPLISLLVVLGMIVALRTVRRHQAPSESLEQKTEPGRENVAFSFDDNRPLTGAASADRERRTGPVRADQQRVELYCDACPSSVQPEPNSGPEYYQIGCISESASLRLSRHKHLHGTKRVSADPQRCDMKMLSDGFKMEPSGKERDKSPTKSQNMDTLNKLSVTMIDAEQSGHSPPCYSKRIPQPELPEPVQCLTFEEISKLNAPPEKTLSNQVFPSRTPMIDVSSDTDTDSTSTFSESEFGHVSVSGTGKYGHEQSNLSTHGCRQLSPVSKFFKLSAAGQLEDENAPSSMFDHWGKILNMHLPYSSYAPVFEDVARLPLEPSHSYDMQSDIEEII